MTRAVFRSSRLVRSVALSAPFAVCVALSLRFATIDGAVTAVWPPAGVALALLLLAGPASWPFIVLGGYLASSFMHAGGWFVLLAPFAAVAECLTCVTLMRRMGVRAFPFATAGDTGRFLVAALVGCGVGAVLGAALGVAVEPWPFSLSTLLAWFVGDFVGIVMFTPICLTWSGPSLPAISRVGRLDVGAGLVLVVLAVAGFGAAPLDRRLHEAVVLLPLVAAIAASVRFGHRGAALGLALLGAYTGLRVAQPGITTIELWDLTTFAATAGVTSLLAGAISTENHEAEKALVVAKNVAEAASKAKSDFLATMSHEIRTPLNGVLGMASLLLGTPVSDEQREYVDAIRGSGDALLGLINDILDFSKIESGRIELERAEFDLAAVLHSAVELVAERAAMKGIELTVVVDDDVPRMLVGDAGRVRQIVLNLVANAVKFTDRGGVVLAVARQQGPTPDASLVVLRVTDTGPGIPDVARAELFEPFTQADASTTRRYGGTGLGLAISRRLVVAMGGTIGMEPRSSGGSTFWFTLPHSSLAGADRTPTFDFAGRQIVLWREADAPADGYVSALARTGATVATTLAAPRPPCPDVVVVDVPASSRGLDAFVAAVDTLPIEQPVVVLVPITLLHQASPLARPSCAVVVKPARAEEVCERVAQVLRGGVDVSAAQPLVDRPEVMGGSVVRVLVAEDNPVNLRVAVRLLERAGCRVDVARNGLEAVAAATAATTTYDVIFMDCQMPELDGFDATRRIRALAPHRRPFIVALTANAIAGDRERCLDAGMDDYLSKPVRPASLEAVLQRVRRPLAA
ncbi:MAG: ATP-binding protein [Vicinamibacterales bacterium]